MFLEFIFKYRKHLMYRNRISVALFNKFLNLNCDFRNVFYAELLIEFGYYMPLSMDELESKNNKASATI